ncbi:MAG: UDP-N-acetylmuramoyl-tripeptide--D-alanyl-D-alanine ligase [Coriobacteriia bacterium]|nr:UDP-N-acetylmuramoyl-tripeptide--D-alanyl-D-alanine ligase [Coriobacteriia bacterium]
MKLNAKQIQLACGGEFLVKGSDAFAIKAQIDSRNIEKGDLFIAFSGEKTDGHKYIDNAIRGGATVICCEKTISENTKTLAKEMGTSIILVDDSLMAINNIAKYWRDKINAKVIGITGSSGKTTTKNLIYDVLSSEFNVCATKGNHNNNIGLPITITESEPNDDILITEMGMNNLGEIQKLCQTAKPEWGLITNVGESHIENLGSRQNIANAKAELAEAIPTGTGKMFLYKEDDYRDYIIERAKLKERNIEVVLFGGREYDPSLDYAQVWAEDVVINNQGQPNFSIHTKDQVATCRLNLRGEHNIINVCAAAAVGLACNISLYDSVSVLNKSLPEVGRQEIIECPGGYTIINDAYNANPESMKVSLKTFSTMKCDGKKIAVLGDMLELGEYTKACHEAVGKQIQNIDKLICVGEQSKYIASASQIEDMILCKDNREALTELEKIIMPKDLVLIKASNGMKLDYVVRGIRS